MSLHLFEIMLKLLFDYYRSEATKLNPKTDYTGHVSEYEFTAIKPI